LIYVILGMHKSGTTLLSQILHHSGINMGDEFDDGVSYDRGNKYERQSSLALNMDILHVNSDNIIDLPAPADLTITDEQRRRMREIIAENTARYSDWGFKDPRTSLTYPLWAAELPPHKLIVIYREPAEIWPRFRYNGWRLFYTNPWRAWKFINRWCEHNINVLSYLRHTQMDYLVFNYRRLMTLDSEFARLEAFVGRPLVDKRRKDLYRIRSDSNWLLNVTSDYVRWRRGVHPEAIKAELDALGTRNSV